jgi:hypothetical protein
MNKDEILLSEAYAKIYNEGIWDRLKGQASGIGAGLRQGAQNLASKAAGALGADVKPTGQGMGGAYANAQQTSLLNSFINKAEREIADFKNDISKMGVNADIESIRQTHPQIATQIDQVEKLVAYLKNPQSSSAPEPAATPEPAVTPEPAAEEGIPHGVQPPEEGGEELEETEVAPDKAKVVSPDEDGSIYIKTGNRWQQYRKNKGQTYVSMASNEIAPSLDEIWVQQGKQMVKNYPKKKTATKTTKKATPKRVVKKSNKK